MTKMRQEKIHFLGIGGISMSALAKYAIRSGYFVSGSDRRRSEQTESLTVIGVNVYTAQTEARRQALEEADTVVYTDAIPADDNELRLAVALGKRVLSRAEFLNLIAKDFRHVLAVAGSHGKTTCTAMCAHVLKATGVPFAAHIGGEDAAFGNFVLSGYEPNDDTTNDGSFFVTEACEYKKNLLKIQSETAILLNIDRDHMECYGSEESLISTFSEYCAKAKTAFVCADDENCRTLNGEYATFGITAPLADYRAVDLRATGEKYAFTVCEYGKPLERVRLNASGRCNVYNALAAFAAMRRYGFDEKTVRAGLEEFTAVKRRFEKIGTYKGAAFICDYAHHPRELASTIETAERTCKGDLFVVFQPHTYSRTKALMEEFVEVLRKVKNPVVYKTYAAREYYDEAGSAATLARNVGSCLYIGTTRELKAWLKRTLKERDTVLFLGAGDIYYAAIHVLRELNK